jgi:PAS domain-containing protein
MNKTKRGRAEKRVPARTSARANPLRATEGRLALVTEAMTEGIYDWNVVTNALYLSDRLKSILGIVELTSHEWAETSIPMISQATQRRLQSTSKVKPKD